MLPLVSFLFYQGHRKCQCQINFKQTYLSTENCSYKIMDLQQLYDQRLQKIDQLKEFIILYSVKCEKYKDIEIISQESVNIKKLLNECANSVRKFQNYNRARITEIIKKSQKQQTIIFNILDKLENEKPNKSIVSFVRQSAQKSILQGKENCLQTPVQKLRLLKLGDTPLMSLDDYMKSPFTLKKTKPISLQFIDFHYAITPIEFSKVPRYVNYKKCNVCMEIV